ncbi:MAG: glycosyltransferase family 2 protein [Armatimonadota bacterium]|nr:MAG: glycosyltransferase family 2 protein [Armatimonadota bacterium]
MVGLELSVIIVSWNTRDILLRCLEALRSGGRAKLEVIVVDNASSDGGPDLVESQFGGGWELKLVRNTLNVGFPKAVNQGLGLASAPYVLLLNPDIVLAPGAADMMLSLLQTRDDVGAVGPKTRMPEGTIQLQCARRLPRLLEFAAERFGLSGLLPRFGLPNRLMSDWDHADSRAIECLSGACVMMRAEELRAIGGLVEEMYLEDNELCWRVRELLRKEVYYLAEAEAVHHHSLSYRAITDRRHYTWIVEMLEAASVKFFVLHSGKATVAAARAIQVLSGLVKLLGLAVVLPVVAWRPDLRNRVVNALCRAYVRAAVGLRGARFESDVRGE